MNYKEQYKQITGKDPVVVNDNSKVAIPTLEYVTWLEEQLDSANACIETMIIEGEDE